MITSTKIVVTDHASERAAERLGMTAAEVEEALRTAVRAGKRAARLAAAWFSRGKRRTVDFRYSSVFVSGDQKCVFLVDFSKRGVAKVTSVTTMEAVKAGPDGGRDGTGKRERD